MIAHFSKLLHETSLGWAVGGGVPWLWPLFSTLHLVGVALLVGYVGAFDLRLLGVAKQLPVAPLQKLMPIGLLGLAVNLVTGIGFYAGSPEQYQNDAFAAKMGCIVLAGLNAVVFNVTGLSGRVVLLGAGQDAPVAARLLALVSLVLWVGVMFWGRMLPVFGTGF